MTRIVLLAASLTVTLSSSAAAQWSVTAFTGDASTAAADIRITSSATAVVLQHVPFSDQSSQSPIYYGGRITWLFRTPSWFGIEAEFVHAKAITNPDTLVQVQGRLAGETVNGERRLGTVLPRFEISHGLNFALANAVVRLDVGKTAGGTRGRIAITGRAGVGPTIPHVEATFDGRKEDGYQIGRIAWQGAAGIQVTLVGRLGAVAEVKFTRTHEKLDIAGAELVSSFRTRHIVAGLVWQLWG